MIDQAMQTELRGRLDEEKARLEGEIANLSTSGISADNFQVDESDAYDQHPADQGSEMFEREKNLAVLRTLQTSLDEVNAALQRMDAGTYGICQNCGKPIDERRLQAMPEAAYDITCQEQIERR